MKLPESIRWRFIRTLGRGGQATVALVEDKQGEHACTFALKSIDNGKPAVAYTRFVREVNATGQLNHTAIIKVVDHSVDDEKFKFYVMEHFEGSRSLKSLLGTIENPFAGRPIEAVDMFIELVDAIAHWSSRGVIHRDLSPANVLVLPDRRIKIIDFGLCQVDSNESITAPGEAVGTPNYMAPECESGSQVAIDAKADLYSAGKILWSAIANKTAFSRETPAFNAASMINVFPESPSTWHLHHLFEKTIRHDTNDRLEPKDLLTLSQRIRSIIISGYPPLEALDKKTCPSCGFGELKDAPFLHMVFGNPNPEGIHSRQCSYCGECFAVSFKTRQTNLQSRSKLR